MREIDKIACENPLLYLLSPAARVLRQYDSFSIDRLNPLSIHR